MSFTQVSLKPSPGFCIKSTTLEPGFLPPPASPSPNEQGQKQSVLSSGGLLELADRPIPVPKGMKVFVNICYDKHVPAPPEASEEAIQRAIKGANPDESLEEDGLKERAKITEKEEEEWYVPVVVSEPRVDKDKSGKPSLVVDCVYHSEVRKRTLRDSGFKVFLVELGLQRIEAQTGLTLSRHIGTPNIASKGKLEPRTVRVPTALLLNSSKQQAKPLTPAQEAVADIAKGAAVKGEGANALDRLLPDSEKAWDDGRKPVDGKKPLIEEVEAAPTSGHEPLQPKSILKKPALASAELKPKPPVPPAATAEQKAKEKELLIPLNVSWNWEKQEDSGRIVVTIQIPDLDESSITSGQTFLDIEPLRILLTIPSANGETRTVDINRTLSDGQLAVNTKQRAKMILERVTNTKVLSVKDQTIGRELEGEVEAECDEDVKRMLLLKREREFDVDGAKAQWVVKDKKLVLTL